MKTVTQEEAKELWCPIIDKPCIGRKCMMFNYLGSEPRPDDKGEIQDIDVFLCGMYK